MRNRRGFTLLEVMVAVAIVGSALVTLIYTVNYHLGIADRQETLTVATFLAMSKIEELRARPSAERGAFDDPYSDYNYRADVEDSDYPGVIKLSVTVSRGPEEVTLRELLLGGTGGGDGGDE